MNDRQSAVRRQADELARQLGEVLGDILIGAYVHGSVALGTFNPKLSDLDVIAVARTRAEDEEKRRLIELLAQASGHPAPIEFHLLAEGDLRPWRHPTPFDFHYSDVWRDALRADLGDTLARQRDFDPDLAAHVTVARRHGIAVQGPPPGDVFPDVPWDDYADSLLRDLRWASESNRPLPLYRVLSPVRIWATLATREIHSKDSGAVWALKRVPTHLRHVLDAALAHYRGETTDFGVEEEALKRFVAYVEAEVLPIARR